MDKAMNGSVCVEAQEYEAMRADAQRYATRNRGSAFTRSGMDATLDGLRRGCEEGTATADQVQAAKTA